MRNPIPNNPKQDPIRGVSGNLADIESGTSDIHPNPNRVGRSVDELVHQRRWFASKRRGAPLGWVEGSGSPRSLYMGPLPLSEKAIGGTFIYIGMERVPSEKVAVDPYRSV